MDAVVIGGGLIGLSIAWRLRQKGLQVSVWDAGLIGAEASWAGAGMLAPGGEIDERSWWGDLARESLKIYPEFVRELQAQTGVTIDYRKCGALENAELPGEWETLRSRVVRQREWGLIVQSVGPGQFFYPDDSVVNPRDLVRALRIACERAGVAIHELDPVQAIVSEAGRILKPEPASVAVLAAGAWSTGIKVRIDGCEPLLEPAIPIRGHLISFSPSRNPPGPILRSGPTYILERADGLTIAGSTTEQVGFEREPNPRHFDDIEQRARKLMPRLKTEPRTAAWIGFRPGTASGEPQLKRLSNSAVFLAYGHYRNGILMAPRTAELLTDLVTASLQTGSLLPVVRP